jgi:hypothetical protein
MNATLNETYLTEFDFLIDQARKDKQAAVQAATQATAYATARATRLEERKEIARNLILESWSTEKIAKTTKLDAAEVEALRREMTTRVM